MSKPVRVAFVVEGDTDLIMLQAAVRSLLQDRELVPTLLQPQDSAVLESGGDPTGVGWPGVHRWCRQTARNAGGQVRNDLLFRNHDVLVIQLDADVAGKTYKSAHIAENIQDLPCERPCPPPSDTTDALRAILLRWMGERAMPPAAVFCTPSRSLEAWVFAALHSGDKIVLPGGLECRKRPESLLVGRPPKLLSRKGNRYQKDPRSGLINGARG